MLKLHLAQEGDLKEIQNLRKEVFVKELNIQHESYRDVFNDSISKNIVVKKNDQIVGSVRLAFSREMQRYYFSYLCLHRNYRNSYVAGMLVGVALHILEQNNEKTIFADALDEQLEKYLRGGCEVIGEKYSKHGFSCKWTPLVYSLGKSLKLEKKITSQMRAKFRKIDCKWRFNTKYVLCNGMLEYRECVDLMTDVESIHGMVPVYLNNFNSALIEKIENVLEKEQIITWEQVNKSFRKNIISDLQNCFDTYNGSLPSNSLIICLNGSPLFNFGKCYSLLTRKKLITLESWEELDKVKSADSIIIFLQKEECTLENYAVIRKKLDRSIWGFFTGASLETISWMIVKNYLYFIEPIRGGDLLFLPTKDGHKITPKEDLQIFYPRNFGDLDRSKFPKNKLRIFSMLSHGIENLVPKSDQSFCGKKLSSQPKENISISKPCCAIGEECCEEGKKPFCYDIDAKVIFTDICFPFSDILPRNETTFISFMDSFASHIVCTYQAKGGCVEENIFFLCLLREGYNFGQSSKYLDRVRSLNNHGKDHYLLFGDPCLRIKSPSYNCASITKVYESNRICFTAEMPKRSFLVHFKIENLPYVKLKCFQIEDELDIHHSFFWEDDVLHLFLYTLDGLPRKVKFFFKIED